MAPIPLTQPSPPLDSSAHHSFLCQVTHTLYPWMSPFWLSKGGGSQVTSSCVAVALWMATFCGAAVGTGGHRGWRVSVHGSQLWKGRWARARWGPWILYLGLKLTCLPNKDLLRRAQGSLTHGVVYAHSDLVTPVLAQIYGGEWGSGTQRSQSWWKESSREAGATGEPGEGGIATILAPHVTTGRKQVESLRCLGCTLPMRLWDAKQARDTKSPSALGSSIQLNLQVSGVETVNNPGHPGPEGQTFLACTLPTMTDAIHFRHVPTVSPSVPFTSSVSPPLLGLGMDSCVLSKVENKPCYWVVCHRQPLQPH